MIKTYKKKVINKNRVKARTIKNKRKIITAGNAFISSEVTMENNDNRIFQTFMNIKEEQYKLTYIVPNQITYINLNSIRRPCFLCKENNKKLFLGTFMIGKKYVNCFVKIEDKWYAVMRIFVAVNRSFLAYLTHTLFYELPDGLIDDDNNIVIDAKNIDNKIVTEKSNKIFGILQNKYSRAFSINNSVPIVRKDKPIFDLLHWFRTQQLILSKLKKQLVYSIFKNLFNIVYTLSTNN